MSKAHTNQPISFAKSSHRSQTQINGHKLSGQLTKNAENESIRWTLDDGRWTMDESIDSQSNEFVLISANKKRRKHSRAICGLFRYSANQFVKTANQNSENLANKSIFVIYVVSVSPQSLYDLHCLFVSISPHLIHISSKKSFHTTSISHTPALIFFAFVEIRSHCLLECV